jgi:hypothetical protein
MYSKHSGKHTGMYSKHSGKHTGMYGKHAKHAKHAKHYGIEHNQYSGMYCAYESSDSDSDDEHVCVKCSKRCDKH